VCVFLAAFFCALYKIHPSTLQVRHFHFHGVDRAHGLWVNLGRLTGNLGWHSVRPGVALPLPVLRLVHRPMAVAHVPPQRRFVARSDDAHGERLFAGVQRDHSDSHQRNGPLHRVSGEREGEYHDTK